MFLEESIYCAVVFGAEVGADTVGCFGGGSALQVWGGQAGLCLVTGAGTAVEACVFCVQVVLGKVWVLLHKASELVCGETTRGRHSQRQRETKRLQQMPTETALETEVAWLFNLLFLIERVRKHKTDDYYFDDQAKFKTKIPFIKTWVNRECLILFSLLPNVIFPVSSVSMAVNRRDTLRWVTPKAVFRITASSISVMAPSSSASNIWRKNCGCHLFDFAFRHATDRVGRLGASLTVLWVGALSLVIGGIIKNKSVLNGLREPYGHRTCSTLRINQVKTWGGLKLELFLFHVATRTDEAFHLMLWNADRSTDVGERVV